MSSMYQVENNPMIVSDDGATYRFPSGLQTCVQFSANVIACCSMYEREEKSTIHIFHTKENNLTLLGVLIYDGGGFTDCSWHHYIRHLLISAVKNGEILLHDTETGINSLPVNVYRGHNTEVTSVKWGFNLNSNKFISTSWSGETVLWDIQCVRPLAIFKQSNAPVFKSQWCPDNDKIIVTAGSDGKLCFWHTDNSTCEEYKIIPAGGGDEFLTFNWSPHNDNQLATAGFHLGSVPVIKLYDTRYITQPFHELYSHTDVISCVKYSPSVRNMLGSCSYDGSVKIWMNGNLFQSVSHHSNIVTCLDINKTDPSVFVDCGFDGLLHVYRPEKFLQTSFDSRL